MKVQIADIKEAGYESSFDLDQAALEEMLNDPSGQVHAASQGLRFEVRLSRVGGTQTIIARGSIQVTLSYLCGRCTADQEMVLDIPLDAVLMPRSEAVGEDEDDQEVELTQEDLDVSFYDGSEIDLSDVVREAIYLEVPTYPSCGIEPAQDCPNWQANMSQQVQKMKDNDGDLRWEALRALKARMSDKADD